MTQIDIQRDKLIEEIRKQFSKMRVIEPIADVLIVGENLNAIDEAHKQKKWAWIKKGAKENPFSNARRYGLIVKKETEVKSYFEYKRPNHVPVDTDTQKLDALRLERRGLYRHILSSVNVRNAVIRALSLPVNSVNMIRRTLESGDLNHELTVYGKVFNFLISERLYDRNYDYYMIGWRNIPHRYWLSKLALKLLSASK